MIAFCTGYQSFYDVKFILYHAEVVVTLGRLWLDEMENK
jgi:hypothetical protein